MRKWQPLTQDLNGGFANFATFENAKNYIFDIFSNLFSVAIGPCSLEVPLVYLIA